MFVETRQDVEQKWLHEDLQRLRQCKSFTDVMDFKLSRAGNLALLIVILDVRMAVECLVMPGLPILLQDVLQVSRCPSMTGGERAVCHCIL